MADFVRDVMTPSAVAVPPDASLVEAAQLMRAQNIGDVLVTSGQQVLGVLTDRDITLRAVADGADPLTLSARAVCTPNPVVVDPSDTVTVAIGLMRQHAIRRLPVVEDGRLVGMVSMGDVAIAQEPESALAEISRADRHGPRRAGRGRPGAGSGSTSARSGSTSDRSGSTSDRSGSTSDRSGSTAEVAEPPTQG